MNQDGSVEAAPVMGQLWEAPYHTELVGLYLRGPWERTDIPGIGSNNTLRVTR